MGSSRSGTRGRGRLGQKALTMGLFLVGQAAYAECQPDSVSLRGPFGTARFDISIADDPAERNRGLMFVEDMAPLQGMLFVYDQPQRVSFWMRNTLIPLDMLFIGADGVLRNIHKEAQPLDETPIFGGEDIQYVLEINGGMSDRLGLAPGDELQHPAFGDGAAWACDISE